MSRDNLAEEIQSFIKGFDFNQVSRRRVEAALNREHRSLDDLAALLSPAASVYLEAMARAARELTARCFGRDIVLYAPLYLANHCLNECLYCGYNRRNDIVRARLSYEEIELEAEALAAEGIRDLLVLTGDSRRHSGPDYLAGAVEILARYFPSLGLEVYPLEINEYQGLHKAGIDFVSLYQETYDPDLYARVHPAGPKRDYAFRLSGPERALAGGVRGVALGALLGLGNFRRDLLACGLHARRLEEKFPQAEISFSVPRLRPYPNRENEFKGVTEAELLQAIVALRLFSPRAAISLSTRESARFRDHCLGLGVTRLSAGVSTAVGGYLGREKGSPQFHRSDRRSVAEIRQAIVRHGGQPVCQHHVRL